MITIGIIKDLIKRQVKTRADLDSFKREIAKKYEIPCPSNIGLLKAYHKLVKNKIVKKSPILEELLRTRPIRSLSGIVNISVLTKPYPCPGKCLYCPTEKGIPKSYVSGEPAVERAKKLNYDPYLQVRKRIEMLKLEGHPTDKIELRIVGGTWSYYPKKYQNWFIKKCFDAGNKKSSKDLKRAQKLNEMARHRIVGLSIETRPDFINLSEIQRLRGLGVTMVELGVQSIYDDVLKINLRGHGVKETILATKLLKDAGFKVLYQMMPNLPGSNLKKDEKMFGELFSNPNFQPDLLKIYPCALLKEAPLYKWWKAGKYKPYTESQLINLVKKIKKKIPYYVRIQRITRDIPSQRILVGAAKISNLRQIIAREMEREGWQCRCIRCREVREKYEPKEKLYLYRQDYDASGGREIFLSFENKNRTKLYSLLRLRITSQNKATVREIHTYGQLYPLRGRVALISPQHKGLGKKLIKEAEKIAKKEFGLNKIAVISGVGVRNYWKKLGYKLKDTYMIKNL
ncbi:MAG: tRNA uridine(34) 5-carboxymethylaminomethyl modification radical SAM/GNAT enzyme Elp3 [Candidatus Nealsonbacteria bacterium CG18_big_fil_WC_8_21_14_2_50_37_10]|uniref:tRNA carboxymethyluridine synthase n=1 Tax=Candidatus Nealsonbacteria bacterium CG18_big_fil_WC_8_21_14_2_50_37_10 TaxID=1974717 RepID=A0A2H0FNG2_9BACT|nr:MAG: tRNA uridine(34) 5-carboxymethylaminomethyl modification radical SAM/GNAT enzyme Elp3 [Candidatus Nealsonbacteria bacterium CG18_big_fil_WC_8_21_14_2_50_37_10]